MKNVKKLKTGLITVNINGRIEVFTPLQFEEYKRGQKQINNALKAFNIGFAIVFVIGVLTGVLNNHLN